MLGDLLTKTEAGLTRNLTYNLSTRPKHAAKTVDGVTQVYDANGNLVSDGTRSFSYDFENRLTQVVSGTNTLQFAYDTDGKRYKKVEGGQSTIYVGKHYEKTGTTETKYYQLLGQPIAMNQGGTTTYLYRDQLGSTSAGSSGSSRSYWPYGDSRVTSGAVSTDRLYTGQRLDPFGLYDYGARQYDPSLGRFITPDTIVPQPGNPQSLNRYSYALGNPLRYTDPTGHDVGDALSFLGGFGQQWAYNNTWFVPGAEEALAVKRDESGYRTFGRHLGNVASMIQGAVEIVGGGGLAGGGAIACGTVVLCAAGAPAMAAGIAVAGHGATVAGGAAGEEGAMLTDVFAATRQKHHIGTDKNWKARSQWSSRFEKLFQKGGMKLSDVDNMVELPEHRGPHPDAYHQWILERLDRAIRGFSEEEDIRVALRTELNAIADDLREHPEWVHSPPD